jgi:hypothetical protein
MEFTRKSVVGSARMALDMVLCKEITLLCLLKWLLSYLSETGTFTDLSVVPVYFGSSWSVSSDYFNIDKCCLDKTVVGLLRKPFSIWNSNIKDADKKTEDDFDCWSSDDGGWKIRSASWKFGRRVRVSQN